MAALAAGGQEATVQRLASALSDFNNSLASSRTGSLAQIWMPEPGEDGALVLNTQGLPYSINGVGDLLALFRCISCKYKFSTDVGQPHQMGAVGRVFVSGEPEMSNHVQRYDHKVYLRAAEAQRCRVHSTLFMPLYGSAARDACLGVFEVVLTDPDVNFAGMVGWIISCLQSQGLYTAEVDTGSLADQRLGLRHVPALGEGDGVSALESGVAARMDRGAAAGAGGMEEGNGIAAGGMVLPTVKREGGGGPAGAFPGSGMAGGEIGGEGAGPAAAAAAGGGAQDGGEGGGAAVQLQRLASGLGPQGMPSPAPQQQHIGVNGGSGSGSGHAAQAPLQPPPAPGGLVGSGGSQPLLAGPHGSGHHSGSGGPASGSTAQQQQQLAAQLPALAVGADPQVVAAAVVNLLQQHAGIAGGLAAPQQLAALLGAPQQQQQQPGSGPGTAPSSALNGGAGAGPLGPSPAVTGGLTAGQPGSSGAAAAGTQQQHGQQQGGGDEEMDEETDEEDRPFLRPAPGAAQKYGQGNRILTYDDLAAQFGYGLKEAAARLNICPTTLKRACRRLGVPRWPRREIAKHKKRKSQARGEGSQPPSQAPPAQQQQQQQANGAAGGSLANGTSGPSSGGSGNPHLQMLGAVAAAVTQQGQQAQQGSGLARPASSSLLNGLPGLEQLPLGGAAAGGAGLPPEVVAAIAGTLQQQGGLQAAAAAQLPGANAALVSQVMQLLQVGAQGMQPGQQAAAGAQPGLPGGPGSGLPPLSGGQLALPLPLQLPGGGGGPGPLPPMSLPQRSSPLPPAPLLSNLGLPRTADSKLGQSVGQGMGSLDILAAADFEVSVGNMSVGNSPRLALSNLGGLSNLGLSAFDFNGAVAGNGPAATATATGGAGGATGPQTGQAYSSGAVSRPPGNK